MKNTVQIQSWEIKVNTINVERYNNVEKCGWKYSSEMKLKNIVEKFAN